MNKFIKSLLVAGAMVMGAFVSAKDVKADNVAMLPKVENITKSTIKSNDDGFCVGSKTTLIGIGKDTVVFIEIIEVICVLN